MWYPRFARWIRNLRGGGYRLYPAWTPGLFRKRRAGFERRWNLEEQGFTKEGFFEVFLAQGLKGVPPGRFYELGAGDGRVGSLGLWLEAADSAWCVEAWEHRPVPRQSILRHRPRTHLHSSRLTGWSRQETAPDIAGITTRGAREAAGVCRAIRQGLIRPRFIGIWNPTRRSAWERRLRREGYCLKLIWHNMEFYGDKKPASDLRIQW